MNLYRFVLPVLLWEAGQMWSVTKHAGDSLHRNYRTKVFEATRICDAAKDLFTLPSFQVKLPQPHFSWDRLPSAAFRCGLREPSSHHPSVFLPMRLWAGELVFIVSVAVDSVCPPTLLHVFTADGARGKRCLLCVRSQWLFCQILCSGPESGSKCITNVTAENLIRVSFFPTSLKNSTIGFLSLDFRPD